MKYSLFIGTLLAASTCLAQSKDPLYKFDNAGDPKEVKTLGANPEFTCLQHKSSPQQVLSAMRQLDKTDSRERRVMNSRLRDAGFDNGIRDVRLSSIDYVTLPSGTTGNMSGGGHNVAYTKLNGDPNGYKAWKLTSESGNSVYFMAKCGNSFAVNDMAAKNTVACAETPVNITSAPRIITTEGTATKRVAEKKTYIYYHKKGYTRPENRYASRNIPDYNPSRPILLRSVKKAEFVPQEYKVTVTPQDDKMNICAGKPVDVAANINVEYSSSYTGNYTNKTNKTYIEVPKRVYKKSLRKLRRAERLEDRVSDWTNVDVNH